MRLVSRVSGFSLESELWAASSVGLAPTCGAAYALPQIVEHDVSANSTQDLEERLPRAVASSSADRSAFHTTLWNACQSTSATSQTDTASDAQPSAPTGAAFTSGVRGGFQVATGRGFDWPPGLHRENAQAIISAGIFGHVERSNTKQQEYATEGAECATNSDHYCSCLSLRASKQR